MGKTAETADDLLMTQDVGKVMIGLGAFFRRCVFNPVAEQGKGTSLVDQVFAVLEGQVEKEPPAARQDEMKAATDGAVRDGASLWVVDIGQR
jgi:hypothetical protein